MTKSAFTSLLMKNSKFVFYHLCVFLIRWTISVMLTISLICTLVFFVGYVFEVPEILKLDFMQPTLATLKLLGDVAALALPTSLIISVMGIIILSLIHFYSEKNKLKLEYKGVSEKS